MGLPGVEKGTFTQQDEKMLLAGAALEWRGQIPDHSRMAFWTSSRLGMSGFHQVVYDHCVDKIQLSIISG